jgi:hypothetical protein
MWLDLTPYMNMSPPVIYDNATCSRAYHTFRSLGLRHLPVINDQNQVKRPPPPLLPLLFLDG